MRLWVLLLFVFMFVVTLHSAFAVDYFYDNFNDSGTYSLGSIYNQNGWNWNAFSTNTAEMQIYNDSGTLVYRQSNVASDYGEETKGVDVPVNDYFINVKLRINSYSSNIGSNYILGDFDNETYDSFKLNCNESGELIINQAMAESKTAVDNTTACDGNWHIVTLECHEGNNSHVAYVDGVPFGVKSDYAKRESGFGHIGAFDTFKDTTSPQSFDMLWINISDNMTIEEEPVPPIIDSPSQYLVSPSNNTILSGDLTSTILEWIYVHENGTNSDRCNLFVNGAFVAPFTNITNNTIENFNLTISNNTAYDWHVWCNDTFGNINDTPLWYFSTNSSSPPLPPVVKYPSQFLVSPLDNAVFSNDTSIVVLNWTYVHENGTNGDVCRLFVNSSDVNDYFNITNGSSEYFNFSVSDGKSYGWLVWCNDTFGNVNQTGLWHFSINRTLWVPNSSLNAGFCPNSDDMTLGLFVLFIFIALFLVVFGFLYNAIIGFVGGVMVVVLSIYFISCLAIFGWLFLVAGLLFCFVCVFRENFG